MYYDDNRIRPTRNVRVREPVLVQIQQPAWKRRRYCPRCGPLWKCKCMRVHPYPQKVTLEGVMVFAIFIVFILMGIGLFGTGAPDGPETLQPPPPTSVSQLDSTGGGESYRVDKR